MNVTLMSCLYIMGSRCSFENNQQIPQDRPIIIVANHQSMFDIIVISWFLREFHPKFISKMELGSGIPSVSFNLKYGGSVLIDRKNPRQSLPALDVFGKYINRHRYAAVIFPEGTRSTDGQPKPFSTTGLKILLKNMPEAVVIPLTINHSWKFLKYGNFPINTGINLHVKVQLPILANSIEEDVLLDLLEQRVTADVI